MTLLNIFFIIIGVALIIWGATPIICLPFLSKTSSAEVMRTSPQPSEYLVGKYFVFLSQKKIRLNSCGTVANQFENTKSINTL